MLGQLKIKPRKFKKWIQYKELKVCRYIMYMVALSSGIQYKELKVLYAQYEADGQH